MFNKKKQKPKPEVIADHRAIDRWLEENPEFKKKIKLSPISIFPNNIIAARFWFSMTVILFFVCIITPFSFYVHALNREHVVIMDSAGVIYRAPMISFHDAKDMHSYIAELAATAILNRNPEGLDSPKLLKQLMLKGAYEKTEESIKKTSARFTKMNIHQKCEIFDAKMLSKDNKFYAIVRGQLIRNGKWQGRAFQEGDKFILKMTMVRNPKFGENLRLPYCVYSYSIKTQKINGGGINHV